MDWHKDRRKSYVAKQLKNHHLKEQSSVKNRPAFGYGKEWGMKREAKSTLDSFLKVSSALSFPSPSFLILFEI